MVVLRVLLLAATLCLVAGDDANVPPGPLLSSSRETVPPKPPTKSTTSSSTPDKTTSATTLKPTITTYSTSTSSTTSTTTAKPTTSPPVTPIGKWVLNYSNTDRICLVLEAAIEIDVDFKVGNSSKTVTLKVNSTAIATGQCLPNVENLNLGFSAGNNLTFHFKKSNDSKQYDIESIIIFLNVSTPGANDTRVIVLVHSKDEFLTPINNSYKCAKEQSLGLTPQTEVKDYEGKLRLSSFQLQAFRNATSTKFDEALDCESYETPDVVPIAVGCALAALVIIVLIAYLIGRRRSQARGYLSMFAPNKREEDYIPMKNLSCFN